MEDKKRKMLSAVILKPAFAIGFFTCGILVFFIGYLALIPNIIWYIIFSECCRKGYLSEGKHGH